MSEVHHEYPGEEVVEAVGPRLACSLIPTAIVVLEFP
jgi:hypothetical protein